MNSVIGVGIATAAEIGVSLAPPEVDCGPFNQAASDFSLGLRGRPVGSRIGRCIEAEQAEKRACPIWYRVVGSGASLALITPRELIALFGRDGLLEDTR
jgi:hypothetical protein